MVQALKTLKMINQNCDIYSQLLLFKINLRNLYLLKTGHCHKLMRMTQCARQIIKFYIKQGLILIEIKRQVKKTIELNKLKNMEKKYQKFVLHYKCN